jgi:hypothetical protein
VAGVKRPRLDARSLLVLGAAAPFAPCAWQFLREGVPDVLFTGDGATLELRVLHAAHATQLLGPYSRFEWSHPGPAFFYLALPVYEAFHRHGPALNLFVLLVNLACAVALALQARKLRGDLFAFATVTLLAVYEGAGADFQLSGEWNPVVPILPLGLLSFLCARLALGAWRTLPAVVLMGSAMVQTHVGFTPAVMVLVTLAAAFNLRRRLTRGQANGGTREASPGLFRWLMASGALLLLVWLPPILESFIHRPGNLTLLARFFTAPHAPEHAWPRVRDAVARQLAAEPLALVRVFGLRLDASVGLARALGAALLVGLAAALRAGVRRGDRTLLVLSTLALGEIGAACFAVRAIRGEIYSYLVLWISMVGLVSHAALAAWLLPVAADRLRPRLRATLSVVALVTSAFALRAQARRAVAFRAHDDDAERLAREVERYVALERLDRPVVRIVTGETWPTAVGVVLDLVKHDVPIFVEPRWLFLMGRELAPTEPGHPALLLGNRSFCELGKTRPDLRLIAVVGEYCSMLGDPDYLRAHRFPGPVLLVAATGVRGDPVRAVDGVIPVEWTPWDWPQSVVLLDKASAIEVAVPAGAADIDGMFLSADGSDIYAVDCVDEAGNARVLGRVLAGVPIGMGTGFLSSDELGSCRTVRVRAEQGDGFYSVGEIGFLRR